MKQCMQCKAEFDGVDGMACPHCGHTPAAEQVVDTMPAPVRLGKRPVELEMGLQIDRTGSSDAFKKGIRDMVAKILGDAQEKVQGIKVSVGTHGDLDCNEKYMTLLTHGTPAEALAAVGNITYDGGGDAEEHHGDGILTALETFPWSASMTSRNVLIAFLTDDSKAITTGKSFGELGAMFLSRRVKLVLVCQPTAKLEELKNAAKGQMIQISNDPSEAELKGVVAQLCKTLTMIVGSGGTRPMPAAVQA